MFGLFKRKRSTRLDDAVWLTEAAKKQGLARTEAAAKQEGKTVIVSSPMQLSASRVQALAAGGKPVLILFSDFSPSLAHDEALLQQIDATEVDVEIQFHTSLENPLLAQFTSGSLKTMLASLGMKPDEAITHRWVTKAIDNARRKAANG
jgi:hypothetical protein